MSGAQLDVPYGDGERARFDYFPCGQRGAPLFVFIYGGYDPHRIYVGWWSADGHWGAVASGMQ